MYIKYSVNCFRSKSLNSSNVLVFLNFNGSQELQHFDQQNLILVF